jgi:hypothetical protein
MKTVDVTLLIPEKDEISACYKMGLKGLNINGIVFPMFAVRPEKKDIVIERLKDEFASELKIEDLNKETNSEKSDFINVIYTMRF